MARYARYVFPEIPHHITQRGNHRQNTFESDADRLVYLDLLGQYCRRDSIQLLGYCLMPNHIHIVAVPQYEYSLSDAFREIHGRYAQYFNTRRHTSGHLWQGRFYSTPMDTTHLFDTLRYVELNPVRAHMVEAAELFAWSSAQAHLTGRDTTGLLHLAPWSVYYTPDLWREALRLGRDEEALNERIRRATQRGHPLGSPEFVAKLETVLGRKIQPNPIGRPKRKTAPEVTQLAAA